MADAQLLADAQQRLVDAQPASTQITSRSIASGMLLRIFSRRRLTSRVSTMFGAINADRRQRDHPEQRGS